MKFSVALQEELSRHSSREGRRQVQSDVYWAMKNRGFNIVCVNESGFLNSDEEGDPLLGRRTYWMRRNNRIDTWEVR